MAKPLINITINLPSETHKISSKVDVSSSEEDGPLKDLIGQIDFMQKAVNEYLTEKIKEAKEPQKQEKDEEDEEENPEENEKTEESPKKVKKQKK